MTVPAFYLASCTASIVGVLAFGPPEPTELIYVAALAVALVGVPHGGLDHLTGRRLLIPYFSERWWVMFFPAYLIIAIAFATGWLIAPVFTVVLFFLISAWHFGREDVKLRFVQVASAAFTARTPSVTRQTIPASTTSLKCYLSAIAMGGLIVFIPALFRGHELRTLLLAIVPMEDVDAAREIATVTQALALLLVPVALVTTTQRIVRSPRDVNHWIPVATMALAATTPILLSFTLYFCGWHSLQGLRRLQSEEALSSAQFLRAVLPLSGLAVVGIALLGWVLRDAAIAVSTGELVARHVWLQTLFIGLSAIAVPHVLLHEMSDYVSTQCQKRFVAEGRVSGDLA